MTSPSIDLSLSIPHWLLVLAGAALLWFTFSLAIRNQDRDVRQRFLALKEHLGLAKFPDVFFGIGAMMWAALAVVLFVGLLNLIVADVTNATKVSEGTGRNPSSRRSANEWPG